MGRGRAGRRQAPNPVFCGEPLLLVRDLHWPSPRVPRHLPPPGHDPRGKSRAKIEGALRCSHIIRWLLQSEGKWLPPPMWAVRVLQNSHADVEQNLLGLIETQPYLARLLSSFNLSVTPLAFEGEGPHGRSDHPLGRFSTSAVSRQAPTHLYFGVETNWKLAARTTAKCTTCLGPSRF